MDEEEKRWMSGILTRFATRRTFGKYPSVEESSFTSQLPENRV